MIDRAELTTSRELDALVAEKVMGWQRYVDGDDWAWGNPAGDDFPELPAYSTDIAAAWDAWETFLDVHPETTWELVPAWEFEHGDKTRHRSGWIVQKADPDWECHAAIAFADTAPLAICHAVLRLVGAIPPQHVTAEGLT